MTTSNTTETGKTETARTETQHKNTTVAARRASVFDAIVEKGQENAKRLEASFSGPVLELAPADLRTNPNNPRTRISQASIDEMAHAIREVGEILQPILVRPIREDDEGCRFEVVCGNRRLLAARHLGMMTVPVRVREVSDDDAARFALWENLARQDLDVLDLSEAINRLRHIDKLTWADTAARFNVSKQWVWQLQKLVELPERVKEKVRGGEISTYNAMLLTQITTGPDDIQALADRIVALGLSSREVIAELNAKKREARQAIVAAAEAAAAAAAEAAARGEEAEDVSAALRKVAKGSFIVEWSPPPGYVSRRYNMVIKAAGTIVDTLGQGRMTGELARALRPVAEALLAVADAPEPEPEEDAPRPRRRRARKASPAKADAAPDADDKNADDKHADDAP